MHQHWVPACYLRAWCDPNSVHLPNPYVWRFSKDGTEARPKSPEKLFRESDMYTLYDEQGEPNQFIERGLSKLEDQFERLRRDKILRCEPLTKRISGSTGVRHRPAGKRMPNLLYCKIVSLGISAN
jgi:hypothetical protein